MRGWGPEVFMILLCVAGGQSRHRVANLLVFFLVHFAVPPLWPGLGHGLEVLTRAAAISHCPHLCLPPRLSDADWAGAGARGAAAAVKPERLRLLKLVPGLTTGVKAYCSSCIISDYFNLFYFCPALSLFSIYLCW